MFHNLNAQIVHYSAFASANELNITGSYEALSFELAEAVAKQLRDKPSSNLGLPTGHTPLGCYRLLSQWSAAGQIDWCQAHSFQLDEYLDPAQPEMTFEYFLETNLLVHTNLPKQSRFNPQRCSDYDELIRAHGGLDLTILGIGTNGHVAFNEPGTVQESWTHCVWLTESTREANKVYFGGQKNVPKKGITMGIETILASRKLILIASGERKREILERALLDPVSEGIPASFLSLHPHVTVITDFELP